MQTDNSIGPFELLKCGTTYFDIKNMYTINNKEMS